jgi:class 3 adenylate cyclase
MPLLEDLKSEVATLFATAWSTRQGLVVPEPSDLRLGNDAVYFERATVLYADLQSSTAMVDGQDWEFSAEIYKTFLHCAAKIIRSEGGTITSYDGDRVMGVWVGKRQTTPAATAGLKINYAVQHIINPALAAQYPNTPFQVKQVVGIDTSPLHATRTGVRGGNDVVWVGRAANYAAKLTTLNMAERTWITDRAYKRVLDEAKFGGTPAQLMWKKYSWKAQSDLPIHGSTWWRKA